MKINMLEGHGIDDVKKIWTTYLNEAKRLADTLNVSLKTHLYDFYLVI
jgi:hypothetical protein